MSRGHQRERDVKKLLESHGWVVVRAAGSMGSIDLVACINGWTHYHPEHGVCALRQGWHIDHALLFIEVKSTAAGPFADFGPMDRLDLIEAAERAGASAFVAWWPPHAGLSWIASAEFPRPGKRMKRERVPSRRGRVPAPGSLPRLPQSIFHLETDKPGQ